MGYVTAPNENAALAEAIKGFQIPSDWQTRVIVARLQIGWLRRFIAEKMKRMRRA
jgi:hypothetical protein